MENIDLAAGLAVGRRNGLPVIHAEIDSTLWHAVICINSLRFSMHENCSLADHLHFQLGGKEAITPGKLDVDSEATAKLADSLEPLSLDFGFWVASRGQRGIF